MICVLLILAAYFIRHQSKKQKLHAQLENTNKAIKESKRDTSLPDEEQPITSLSAVSPSSNSSYDYQQQFDAQQQQQLQQMLMMQQYQSQTNFRNPQAIAAYQALSFCPPR